MLVILKMERHMDKENVSNLMGKLRKGFGYILSLLGKIHKMVSQ